MSEEIRRLTAGYADAVCRRDAAAWSDTWTVDGTWEMGPMAWQGRDRLVEVWSGMMAGLEGVVHHCMNGWSDLDEVSGKGTGRWHFTEHVKPRSSDPISMHGFYDDEYRLVDNEWRFSRRTLTTLYHGPPDVSGAFIDPTV